LDCTTAHLSVTPHAYGEAGGQFRETFTFENRSRATCRLAGWPRLQIADAAGRAQDTTTQRVRQNSPPLPAWTSVAIKPHATASFDVYGADYDALHNHACSETSAAFITLPHNTTRLSIGVRMPDCGYALYVSPVIAGGSDTPSWSEVVQWKPDALEWLPKSSHPHRNSRHRR
jgi:hypothetical protein